MEGSNGTSSERNDETIRKAASSETDSDDISWIPLARFEENDDEENRGGLKELVGQPVSAPTSQCFSTKLDAEKGSNRVFRENRGEKKLIADYMNEVQSLASPPSFSLIVSTLKSFEVLCDERTEEFLINIVALLEDYNSQLIDAIKRVSAAAKTTAPSPIKTNKNETTNSSCSAQSAEHSL
uniref:SCAPER_N domain-containing protein n=1 Tax=Caenorhabditis tropicalis TaxID=1561998 RepID=A0A1I7V4F3_9PELO